MEKSEYKSTAEILADITIDLVRCEDLLKMAFYELKTHNTSHSPAYIDIFNYLNNKNLL